DSFFVSSRHLPSYASDAVGARLTPLRMPEMRIFLSKTSLREESKMSTPTQVSTTRSAVLDSAHVGDIRGALGTIAHHDTAPRNNWWARFRTLLAILGPGLIVMVGDNDAGAFGTYTQAGQNYGTTLLWTMLLLVPVLFVNQEMVLRLGAVTGVGHARL